MFKFRKIASVLASAVMITSTVALAAAANYPAPFNTVGSTAIVYGQASPLQTDLVAATAISTALNSQILTQTATSSSSMATVSGGDFVKLEKTSTKFQLGKGVTDVVSGSVTKDDLKTLLADGVYRDSNNDEFDYTQKISLANLSLTQWEDNDYKADVPTVGIRVASGNPVLNYTVDFTDQPKWTNLASTDISLLGKDYYVLSTNAPTNTTLTLLDSANTVIVDEGKTQSVTVGSKSYDVSVTYVSLTKAKLSVGGEVTNSLAEGQTYKLKDGTYVGVKSILYNSKDTGVSSVEFSIGSGKLVLQNGSDVQMNDNTISRLKSYLVSGSAGTLSKIILAWSTDNDAFAANDSDIVMPGFNALKVSFGGMTFPVSEEVQVQAGGDDYFTLKSFPLKNGAEDIDILYGNRSHWMGIGREATRQLRTAAPGANITFDGDTDQYFVASFNDGTNAESYLLKATNFKTTDGGVTNKTSFQYRKDGSWTDASVDRQAGDSFTVGNAELKVSTIDVNGKSVIVGPGTNTNFNTLYSEQGLKVFLPYNGTFAAAAGGINLTGNATTTSFPTSFALIFSEEDKNENIGQGANVTATLSWNGASNPQAHISNVVNSSGTAGTFTEIESSKVYQNFLYSPLATEMLWDKSGDQYGLSLVYHGKESYGNVFVTDTSAVVSGGDGGSTLGVPVILDSEIASASGKNLIVVGGSCVNTVAASLLGSSTPLCGDAFTATTGVGSDQFLIQTFDRTGGKVATLVAGYAAGDTTNAATYLRTATVDTTVGKKYIGTSATQATVVTN